MPDSWDFADPADETSKPPPILMTWAMVGLCVILTLLWWTSSENPGLEYLWHALRPLPDQIWAGQYYSLFTSVFIHGGIMHLAFNMMWLLRLGAILEQTLNPLAWALFFIAASVAGSCAELALSGDTGIGASGVVYAMFGLVWAGRARFPAWAAVATRDNLNLFIGWGVLCIVLTYFDLMAIANGAHAGGFIFGLAVGWLVGSTRYRIPAALLLASMAALTALSVTWMPWSGRWTAWTAGKAFEAQDYPLAIERYRRSLKLGFSREVGWENIARAYENLGNQSAATEARLHAVEARVEEVRKRLEEKPAPGLLETLRESGDK